MLIRNAEVWRHGMADIRISAGRITALGRLEASPSGTILDAAGGALLPGLHDHHIHLTALAATRASVPCGPPDVNDADELKVRLSISGAGWLRGIGYHESVAGMLDAAMLDQMAANRPVRIQHRSGRMWFLNSAALEILLSTTTLPPGMERIGGRYTGRLFDEDRWLRDALGSTPPLLGEISAQLAGYGITGITEMSPANDPAAARYLAQEQSAQRLRQRCVVAGTFALADANFDAWLRLGPTKLHLHEQDLPDFDDSVGFIRAGHAQGRPVAIHCTTETELVFAMAALEEAGVIPGDRIEHGSVMPQQALGEIARLGLWVVTQPHFIAERGDQYLTDVEARDVPTLYRLKSIAAAGIVLAGGSDAPFGDADPWAAMRAAVARRTRAGNIMREDERLDPEEALALFLADPSDLSRQRRIEVGMDADLCLLDRPWNEARTRLRADDVRATLIDGSIVHDRVDQAPVQRGPGADPLA